MKRGLAPLAIGTLGAVVLVDFVAASLGLVLPVSVHLSVGAALAIGFALVVRPFGKGAACTLGTTAVVLALLLLVFPLGPRKWLLRHERTLASHSRERVAERLEGAGLERDTLAPYGPGGIEGT